MISPQNSSCSSEKVNGRSTPWNMKLLEHTTGNVKVSLVKIV